MSNIFFYNLSVVVCATILGFYVIEGLLLSRDLSFYNTTNKARIAL
jgi:hypothetical protein